MPKSPDIEPNGGVGEELVFSRRSIFEMTGAAAGERALTAVVGGSETTLFEAALAASMNSLRKTGAGHTARPLTDSAMTDLSIKADQDISLEAQNQFSYPKEPPEGARRLADRVFYTTDQTPDTNRSFAGLLFKTGVKVAPGEVTRGSFHMITDEGVKELRVSQRFATDISPTGEGSFTNLTRDLALAARDGRFSIGTSIVPLSEQNALYLRDYPVAGGGTNPLRDYLPYLTLVGDENAAFDRKGQYVLQILKPGGKIETDPKRFSVFNEITMGSVRFDEGGWGFEQAEHNVPPLFFTDALEKYGSYQKIERILGFPIIEPVFVESPEEGGEVLRLVQFFEKRVMTARFDPRRQDDPPLIEEGLIGDPLAAAFNDGNANVQDLYKGDPTFPSEIGEVNQHGISITNKGQQRRVVDNPTDPENNWRALVEVARRFAPGQQFEFFNYDKPEDVPVAPPEPGYNAIVRWNQYPGTADGRQYRIKTPNNIWQLHQNIPIVLPEYRDGLNQAFIQTVLRFFIDKDNAATGWGPDFSAVLRKYTHDPYNNGKMNFPLKIVYR